MSLSIKERDMIVKSLDRFAENYKASDNSRDKSNINFCCYAFIENLCTEKPDWEMYIKYYNDCKGVIN